MMKAAFIRTEKIDIGLDCESERHIVETLYNISSREQAEEMRKDFNFDYVMIVDKSVLKGMRYDPDTNTIHDVDGNLVYPTLTDAEKLDQLEKENARLKSELLDTQMAICDIYETMIGG